MNLAEEIQKYRRALVMESAMFGGGIYDSPKSKETVEEDSDSDSQLSDEVAEFKKLRDSFQKKQKAAEQAKKKLHKYMVATKKKMSKKSKTKAKEGEEK